MTTNERTGSAEQIAAEIVRAELEDNYFLADMLRPRLREANRERKALGLKPIRATQHWYFDEQFQRALGTQRRNER